MIQLTRDRNAIPASFRDDKRIDKAVELLTAYVAAKKKNKPLGASYWKGVSSYWGKAKEQLRAESFDKCAYCEERAATASYCDVEHFRPKAVYWWLAFCYDNYLYSCQRCNQQFKSDGFPTANPQRMSLAVPAGLSSKAKLREFARRMAPDGTAAGFAAYVPLAKAELAGLPDPYSDDPEPLFKWQPGDEALREVRVAAANTSPRAVAAFAAAEKYFGLNRDELLKARWQEYRVIEGMKELVGRLPSNERKQAAKLAFGPVLSAGMPFLAMKRYFIERVWKLV